MKEIFVRLGLRGSALLRASEPAPFPTLLNHATPATASPRPASIAVRRLSHSARCGEGGRSEPRGNRESAPSAFGFRVGKNLGRPVSELVGLTTRRGLGRHRGGSARVPRLEFSDVRQLHPVVIVPPDRFRSFVLHIHHALVGHPHRGALIYPTSFVFLPILFALSCFGSSPCGAVESFRTLRARELKRNALRRRARSAAIGLANDGAWPPRHAAKPSRRRSGHGP